MRVQHKTNSGIIEKENTLLSISKIELTKCWNVVNVGEIEKSEMTFRPFGKLAMWWYTSPS